MSKHTTLPVLAGLLAATLVPSGCRDAASPDRRSPALAASAFATAASPIALDQQNGALNQTNTALLRKGFNPTNPQLGTAIIATFFWLGTTATVVEVTDVLADGTPVGNTYEPVEYITGDGVSMATFVATNVQNFPEGTFPNGDRTLVVQATLSDVVDDGGVMISSYSGVDPVFPDALGEHRSDAGSASTQTIAHPGAVTLNAGALAYGATLSNRRVDVLPPADFTRLIVGPMENGFLKTDGAFTVRAGGGSVDPQWTWSFNQNPEPGTWLASVVALNPAATPTGNLMVSNTTTGSSFPSSYTVTVDAGTSSPTSQPMAPDGSVTFTDLPAGDHSVTLTVANNCTVTSSNPVNVDVPAGGTASTSFDVTCTTPPGTLRVTTSTTGSSLDPDGYTVTVNGQSQAIATNNSTGITFTLAPGSYSVTLSGVAANCTVTSANPQQVTVPSGGTVTAAFTVSCTTQQARAQVSGGGRIDPSNGKTTFGFNVDGRSGSSFQGETEVVYHGGTSRMTRIHSSFIDGMTTSSDSRGGLCVTWTGSARVDNGAQRRFTATACDNGQPNGSAGPDRFGITVDGVISIGLTDLKGGNTQARQ